MFASLNCMHYHWKNCPVVWQSSFIDKDGNKSIILETITNQRLWISHAYFGLSKSNNDLNVLNRSPLIRDFLGGVDMNFSFEVNGNKHSRYYLLVDKIYPWWFCFISTIHEPQG